MIGRGTLIVALVALECVIVAEAVLAVRLGGRGAPTPAGAAVRLVEDGPDQIFATTAHPALRVDIGYADLTVVTAPATQIAVRVRGSRDFGFLRATAPITSEKEGDTVSIVTPHNAKWSIGDDRMVTVLVPADTAVTVVSAGDIRANGLRAESSFNSTGQGTATVEDYAAPALHVESSNGLISLRRIVTSRLDVTSSNDRVEGSALTLRDGSIVSDDRVSLGFAAGSDSLVTAATNEGKVHVWGLTDSTGTGQRGNTAADDVDTASQTVRVGPGNGHLDIHVDEGNINLARDR